MNFNWNNNYLLGIEDIDSQHHSFLNLIKKLNDVFQSVEDPKYVKKLIAEINAYAKYHFISEENFMYSINYPNIEEHRLEHLEILDVLSEKEIALSINNFNEACEEIIAFLLKWFKSHTSLEDKQIATFYFKNKVQIGDHSERNAEKS
ncbi:MAG: hemerythrin family protein [Leptospiraceae bacterium]|nr:hemerythrin family protein [Leptospiraceae bacterium]MCP5503165.1 hemerythrin family protein [Leptospiraceae bacterium]